MTTARLYLRESFFGEKENICLPATAETEGYCAEKAKGKVRSLAGGKTVRFDMEMGLLGRAEASEMASAIGRIMEGAGRR